MSEVERGALPRQEEEVEAPRSYSQRQVTLAVGGGTALVSLLALGLWARAELTHRPAALAADPKGVTVTTAQSADYRGQHRYVGSLEAWDEAKVGPQFISAYVTEVLVRPGDQVRRGQVLARLEPQRAQAEQEATRLQAQALETQLVAVQKESERIQGLMKKGIVSVNEAERKLADAQSQAAKLGAAKSQLESTRLEVEDSTLRAPFDGEVSDRQLDPGAFVHPGTPIVSVVDRRRVRISADAPESDFDLLAPGTVVRLHVLSTNRELTATISRRSPAADPSTRTIHFEMDMANADRSLPVGATAELFVSDAKPRPALAVPAAAVVVRSGSATLWVVKDGTVHKAVVPMLGEADGRFFLDPALGAGAQVVIEGRGQLQEGDRVNARTSS